MRLRQINTCCCWFSLQAGTIIISVLDIISGALIFTMTATNMIDQNLMGQDFRIAIALIIHGAFNVIVSILLFVGALNNIRFLMIPWLVYLLVYITVIDGILLYTAISYLVNSQFILGNIYIISIFLIIGTSGYYFLVVYSLYRNLAKQSTNDISTSENFDEIDLKP